MQRRFTKPYELHLIYFSNHLFDYFTVYRHLHKAGATRPVDDGPRTMWASKITLVRDFDFHVHGKVSKRKKPGELVVDPVPKLGHPTYAPELPKVVRY